MTSPKFRLEFLLFLGLVVAGLALRQTALLALALPLGWHLLWGTGLAPEELPEGLRASRHLAPRRVQEGTLLSVRVEVKNEGAHTLEVHAADAVPEGVAVVEGETAGVAVLRPGDSLVLSYRIRPGRGIHRFPEVRVEARPPWSLVAAHGTLPCPGEVVVLPRLQPLRLWEARARRALAVPGTARARRGGLGLEFYGVREFQPGDVARKLAWKAMARRETPVVVEFEEERALEVALILDTRRQAYRDQVELFDPAVRAAASLALHFLHQGHRLGLLQYGALVDWVFPGYGRRHAERILRELARARLGESHVFQELAHLPTRLFPAGSLLVLVSPLLLGDEETLARLVARGYTVWVLVPEGGGAAGGSSWEAQLARRILRLERTALLRRVQRSGARVVIWPVDRPLGAVLRRARPLLCR